MIHHPRERISALSDGICSIRRLVCTLYDYHFRYQTYDVRWANKHGQTPSDPLDYGITPFSTGTSGWGLNLGQQLYPDGQTIEHNYSDFYDSEIFSYIITVS